MADSYCNNIQRLKVAGDSKLAIELMKKKVNPYSPNIVPLVEGNRTLANFFESIKFTHIKRDLNEEADELANSVFGVRKRRNAKSE